MLVLAAGVPAAFQRFDFTVVTIGYVIMRVAMIGQWLRAAHEHPRGRATALRYALGYAVVQAGWVARLALPGVWGLAGFAVLALADVLVPIVAERAGGRPTSWHPEHIAERYGLFTLIVLGECVLAATVAVQSALSAHGLSASLLALSGGGLLLVFGIWWSYFKRPADEALRTSPRSAFVWGYGQFAVFAAVAALGAGLQVAAEAAAHGGGARLGPALAVATPVAVYLVVAAAMQAWMLHLPRVALRFLVAAALVLVAAAAGAAVPPPVAVLAMGVVLTGLISVDVIESELRLRRGPAVRE